MNHATPSEIRLALRSSDAGWLGVLACVIDEASRDPRFDERQRQLALQLLQEGPLPPGLLDTARERAACFEAELDTGMDFSEPPALERPKLTLVGTHG